MSNNTKKNITKIRNLRKSISDPDLARFPGSILEMSIVIVSVVSVVIIGGLVLYHFSWSGFRERTTINSSTSTENNFDNKGIEKISKKITTDKLEPAKTLWDWIGLLIGPVFLAYLGWLFKSLQEKAAAVEQHEVALQDYLKILSELIVDKQLIQILKTDPTTASQILPKIDTQAAKAVIKARTLSLLRLFHDDIPRKASVLSFLGDADLLSYLNLDLFQSDFTNANLKKANLTRAIFTEANFTNADLTKAILFNATLNDADFTNATLTEVDFTGANLTGANFTGAILTKANFRGAICKEGDFIEDNLIPMGFTKEDLSGVQFGEINILKKVDQPGVPQKITYDFTVRIKSGSKSGQIFTGFFSYDPSSPKKEGKKEGEELITVSEIQFHYISLYDTDKPDIVLVNQEFKRLKWVGGLPTEKFGFNTGFDRQQFGRDEEAFIREQKDYFGYLNRNTYVDGAGIIEYKLRETT